jgi:hypothetical protein
MTFWARKRCSVPSSSFHGDHAAAGAFLVHDEVDGEILDEEFGRVAQRLAIERVQHGVAGAVGGGAGALGRTLRHIWVMPPNGRW